MKVTYKVNGKTVTKKQLRSGTKRLKEILETRQFPGVQTDDDFMKNRGTLRDQLGTQTDMVVNAAKAKGYTPSQNDVYLPALANSIGDPAAFVKHSGARGHIRRVCESRDWECDGAVKVKRDFRTKVDKKPTLAKDLVIQYAAEKAKKDKHIAKASLAEVTADAVRDHGPK